jgi:DNA-binding Lrp family transcriptional regulator
MNKVFDWRAHLPVHPAANAFPEMPHDELIALGNDIKMNGLRLPIVVHRYGDAGKASNPEFKLLDGRSRLDAMAAIGIELNIERIYCKEHGQTLRLDIPNTSGATIYTAAGLSEDEIKSLVLSVNAFRRHLDAKARRAAIDTLLKLDPGKSDRQIAEQTGSSPTTVGKRRKKAESAGDVSKMDTRIDTKGRKQPAKKQKAKPTAAADDAAASAAAMKARHAAREEARRAAEQIKRIKEQFKRASANPNFTHEFFGGGAPKYDEELHAERDLAIRMIDTGYRTMAKINHPDVGGPKDIMVRLNHVRDRLKTLVEGDKS